MDDPYAIFFREYLRSASELIQKIAHHLDRLASDPRSGNDLIALRRAWHSLRGNSAFVPDCPVTALAEAAEEAVEAVVEQGATITPLLAHLGTVLDEIRAWLAGEGAARSQGSAPPPPRPPRASVELRSALAALAAARRAANAPHRYYYGGEDVSDLLELLEREDTASSLASEEARAVAAHPDLAVVIDRLRPLAEKEGESASAELDGAGMGEIRDLIRFLAARVVCVSVASR
jgi:chemotaxis protein histidine kinase CheA